jgi:hypothetical protein
MKTRVLSLAILAACAGMTAAAATVAPSPAAPRPVAAAQAQPLAPAQPPAPGQADPIPPPPPPPTASSQRSVQLSGRIARFLINPNGDVDGVLLADHTQVDIPPTLGASLTAKARTGDRLDIEGFRVGTLPLVRAASLGLPNGDKLVDTPPAVPPAPPAPPALQPMEAQGRVTQALLGPMGEVNGVILDNGPIVRVPPPAAVDNPLLQPGARLSAKGFGVESRFGKALQATAIGASPGTERPLVQPPQPGQLPPPPPAPPAPPQTVPGPANTVGMVPPPVR